MSNASPMTYQWLAAMNDSATRGTLYLAPWLTQQ
jgi:hypothetical protein